MLHLKLALVLILSSTLHLDLKSHQLLVDILLTGLLSLGLIRVTRSGDRSTLLFADRVAENASVVTVGT